MKKRIMSILLAFVLVITLLPVAAFAVEGDAGNGGDSLNNGDGNEVYSIGDDTELLPLAHTDHCVCGGSVTVGGHIHDTTTPTWTEWDGTSNITYTNNVAYVYLTGDAERDSTLTIPTDMVLNLCLNGCTLQYVDDDDDVTDYASVITVAKGATLNLTDCGIDGSITGGTGTIVYNNSNYVYGGGVYTKGTFNLYGGNISNNTAKNGGGVYVESGTFNMMGGSIICNTANLVGGGVDAEYPTNFTLYDGTISANTAQTSSGGGVFGYTYSIRGGTISGNTAGDIGGGAYSSQGIHLSGSPTFRDNSAADGGNDIVLFSGALLTIDQTFAPTSPIGIALFSQIGLDDYQYLGCFAAVADGANIADIAAYAQYFTGEGYPLYAKNNMLYVGYTITEHPNADNNYTVGVNDNTDAHYQWCTVAVADVAVTSEYLAANEGLNYGTYDSENGWTALMDSGLSVYFMVVLNEADTLTAEFDQSVSGDVRLMHLNNGDFAQATKSGNTYTFMASADDCYILLVESSEAQPTVKATLTKKTYTNLDGQTSATLNTADLGSGTYVCKVTWGTSTEENTVDDCTLISACVEYSNVHTHCVCGGSVTVGGHIHDTTTPTWTEWDGTSNITYTNNVAYVYLTGDAERSSALTISTGKTLYLCLNGHELRNTGSNQRVLDITGGTLYLTDCGSTGTITGGSFTSKSMMETEMTGSGVRVKDDGTFHMYGGTITGNSSVGSGAVAVGYNSAYGVSTGTFHMYDGTISGNESKTGGGIFVREGSFTMHDGTISNNTASGPIGGGGVYVQNTDTFTMHGGTISGNTASNGSGGGVRGNFIMTGGTISENTASNGSGGGVYGTVTMTNGCIEDNTASKGSSVSGSLKISGSPKIRGDVYLGSSGKITITDDLPLPEGYQTIPVYSAKDEQHVAITDGASDYGVITDGEQNIFVAQDTENTRIHVHNGEVCQEGKPTVTFDANGGSPTPDTQTLPFEGGKATAPAEDPTRNRYVFSHWCDNESCTDYTNCSGWNFDTVITESKTIYAIWESITVTITSEPGKLTAVTSHPATAYQWSTLSDADYPLNAEKIRIGTGYYAPTLWVDGFLDNSNWLPNDEDEDSRFNIYYFNVYPDDSSIPAGVLTVTLNDALPDGCVLKLMPYEGETVIEPISVSGNTYQWATEENGDYILVANAPDNMTAENMPSVTAVFTVPNGAFNPIDGETNAIFTNGENGKEYKVTATFEGGSEITSASEVFEELTVYTVTANPTEGGTVNVDKTSATAGETVTITATPNEGYEVDTVTVYKTDEENTTVAVSENKFTMPAHPVTVRVTFKVSVISVPEPTASGSYTYNGTEQTVALEGFNDTYMTIVEGTNKATNAGSYEVTINLDGNHKWADGSDGKVQWTIGAKAVTPAATLEHPSFAYNGSEHKPAVTVKDGSTEIPSTEYTIAYANNINVGTASVTITDKEGGNYAFAEITKTFRITQEGISPTLTMENYVYGSTPAVPNVSGNTSGGTVTIYYSTDSSKVDMVWENISGMTLNAGTYYMKVHVAATDNFAEGVSKVVAFKVTPAKYAAPAAPSANEFTVTIEGADRSKALEYSLDGINWNKVPALTNGAFELKGLTESTQYTIYLRVKASADGNYQASDTVSTTWTTPARYSVAYHANLGTGNVPASVTQNSGRSVTVAYGSDLKRSGYTFAGWNTAADGSGTDYAPGSSISTGATLYAKWTADSYTVKFDANSGSGTMDDQRFTYDAAQVLTGTAFVREGYHFVGWATGNGNTALYLDRQLVKNLTEKDTVTLYAVWTENVYSVGITITSDTDTQSTVKLMRGDSLVGEVKTVLMTQNGDEYAGSVQFDDVPKGTYNIVVKQGDITMTKLIIITNHDVSDSITMPAGNVNSVLDVKGEDTLLVVVGGLEDEAVTKAEDSKTVTITMTVEKQEEQQLPETASETDKATQEAIEEIIDEASDKSLEFMDIVVEKRVEEDGQEDVTEKLSETNNVLEIVIPFDITGKKSFVIYRYHNGQTEQFIENTTKADGTFYIDEDNQLIHVFSQKFSTYAIGYTTESEPEPDRPVIPSIPTPTPKPDPKPEPDPFPSPNPESPAQIHSCTSNCDVCGGCEDVACTENGCKNKCLLLSMYFADVAVGKWYTDAVEYVYHRGMMQGVGNDHFDVDGTTTRAMIVTLLWRLEGCPVVNYLADFDDVGADQWYTEAVRWAASEQIVEGYGSGKFGTNDAITREQMVTIMWRYARYKGYDVSVGEDTNILSYGDAFDVAEWAIPAMQWACGTSLMQGDGKYLTPKAYTTRAQTATILWRFCEMIPIN